MLCIQDPYAATSFLYSHRLVPRFPPVLSVAVMLQVAFLATVPAPGSLRADIVFMSSLVGGPLGVSLLRVWILRRAATLNVPPSVAFALSVVAGEQWCWCQIVY